MKKKKDKNPNQMTTEEFLETRQITSTPEEFAKHLERARKIVESWPEWKRRI